MNNFNMYFALHRHNYLHIVERSVSILRQYFTHGRHNYLHIVERSVSTLRQYITHGRKIGKMTLVIFILFSWKKMYYSNRNE